MSSKYLNSFIHENFYFWWIIVHYHFINFYLLFKYLFLKLCSFHMIVCILAYIFDTVIHSSKRSISIFVLAFVSHLTIETSTSCSCFEMQACVAHFVICDCTLLLHSEHFVIRAHYHPEMKLCISYSTHHSKINTWLYKWCAEHAMLPLHKDLKWKLKPSCNAIFQTFATKWHNSTFKYKLVS